MIAIYVHVVMLWLEVVKNGRIFAFVNVIYTLQLVCYSREMLHHKVLDGRVALSCGETLWLDPVEHRVTLKGKNTQD